MSDDRSDAQKALGQAFFQGDARQYVQNLDLKLQERAARDDLRDATGIEDPAVLAELAGLGIRVDTLAALTLIPLIDVAWADGTMDAAERKAVLEGAIATGIQGGSTSYRLLEIWTEEEPPVDLRNAWAAFMREVCRELRADEIERMKQKILGRARDVAASAGSARNRSPHISPEEEASLASLAKAFES